VGGELMILDLEFKIFQWWGRYRRGRPWFLAHNESKNEE
jgi:hypothetical protein